jgi:ferrochelatase
MTFDALLLACFGGPEGPDDVVPFLERVTAGRGIPPERLLEVGQHYLTLGGVSPINAQNRALAQALRDELADRGIDLPVYLGNRNSPPFFADILRDIHADGHSRVLALATSAYSSYSGCRQYREDLAKALTETGLTGEVVVQKVSPFGDLDGFVAAMAPALVDALGGLVDEHGTLDGTHVFFTTHSIPDSMVAASGPQTGASTQQYVDQHLEVARALMSAVGARFDPAPPWSLVYQSRSGPPTMPWLEPDINDALSSVGASGVRSVIVVPIGFISDHIEVIWDLDTQARQTADGLGLSFTRVPTAGTSPAFVEALVDRIEEAAQGGAGARGRLWSGLCSTQCCANARATLDVIPGIG